MARTRVSFASCNLYNLNRPGLPIYRDRDGWDEAAYERKVDWTAAQVRRLGADVWGFQELWHQVALADVFDAAGLAGDYRLLTPTVQQAGQRVRALRVDHGEPGHDDPTGDLAPGRGAVVAVQLEQGVRIDQPAPLHRPADPVQSIPVRGPQDGDGGVEPDGALGGRGQIDEGQPAPGPLDRGLEMAALPGELVPQDEGMGEQGRGEDVRGMERDLPGLGPAGDVVPIQRVLALQKVEGAASQVRVAGDGGGGEDRNQFARPVAVGMRLEVGAPVVQLAGLGGVVEPPGGPEGCGLETGIGQHAPEMPVQASRPVQGRRQGLAVPLPGWRASPSSSIRRRRSMTSGWASV